VHVDHLALSIRVAHVLLSEAHILNMTGLLLLEFVEVGHHVTDRLLVHGHSLL
jgi:hypothetical protein